MPMRLRTVPTPRLPSSPAARIWCRCAPICSRRSGTPACLTFPPPWCRPSRCRLSRPAPTTANGIWTASPPAASPTTSSRSSSTTVPRSTAASRSAPTSLSPTTGPRPSTSPSAAAKSSMPHWAAWPPMTMRSCRPRRRARRYSSPPATRAPPAVW